MGFTIQLQLTESWTVLFFFNLRSTLDTNSTLIEFLFIYLFIIDFHSFIYLFISRDKPEWCKFAAQFRRSGLSYFTVTFCHAIQSLRVHVALSCFLSQMHPKLLGLWCVHAHWQTQSQSEFQRKRCCEILPILEKIHSFALICPACICLLLFIGLVPIDNFFDFCHYLLIKPQHTFHSLSKQVF